MNKRQKKKNQNKYLLIMTDEFNLSTMTREESKKAWEDYMKFKERFAFRKKYIDLKANKRLRYIFPPGQQMTDALKELSNVTRRELKIKTVTQSLNDFK